MEEAHSIVAGSIVEHFLFFLSFSPRLSGFVDCFSLEQPPPPPISPFELRAVNLLTCASIAFRLALHSRLSNILKLTSSTGRLLFLFVCLHVGVRVIGFPLAFFFTTFPHVVLQSCFQAEAFLLCFYTPSRSALWQGALSVCGLVTRN